MSLRLAFPALVAGCGTLAACAGPEVDVGSVGEAVLVPPADSAFVPFTCDGSPATDPLPDAPEDHRDAVGDAGAPAIYRASDDATLYLRIRLDGEPGPQPDLKSHGWGFLFDTDGILNTYEILAMATGAGGNDAITLQRNTDKQPGFPDDEAEELIASYTPVVDSWVSARATDSSFDGDPDFFLTFGIPWADLEDSGISRTNTVVLWAGTTTSKQALNLDFVCYDDDDGPPVFGDLPSDGQMLDPLGDADGDGIGNQAEVDIGTDPNDADTDDDGLPDGAENAPGGDADGDGQVNADDPDADDDGIFDGTEAGVTEPGPDTDTGAGVFRPDADPDTTTDPQDADTDDGGVPDGVEDANHNGNVNGGAGETDPNDPSDDGADSDGDGLPDALEEDIGTDPEDPDSDNDGIDDNVETDGGAAVDSDGDQTIDALDTDADDDGIPDQTEGTGDTDGDGDGDWRDPDDDDDGVPTADEEGIGTDHLDADTDDDGLGDGAESDPGGDADGDGMVNAADPDSDDDGLYDGTEAGVTEPAPGTDQGAGVFIADQDPDSTTDPFDADSDDGGIPDGVEDANHDGEVDTGETDPNDPSDDLLDDDGDTIPNNVEGSDDADGDETPNDGDLDSDGDGISDADEAGDDDPASAPVDTDGDGTPDYLDTDADDDGIPDAEEAGDGELDTPPVDTDEDGTPDFQDPDSDGDGNPDADDECPTVPDPCEAGGDDSDGDGVPDGEDNCPDDANPDQSDADGDGRGDVCQGDVPGFGISVSGGGCSAAGGAGSGGGALVLLLALGLLAGRRRRLAGLLGAILAIAASAPAGAQERSFAVERFRLASDADGMLDVEAGNVPAHLMWSVGLWLGHSDDPLVAFRTDTGERVASLVSQRTGGDLVGSLALFGRVELGVALPIIVNQDSADAGSGLEMAELSSAGLGDLRLTPKVMLFGNQRGGVAALVGVTLPTSSADDDYFGDDQATFAPELAASIWAGRLLLGANVGFRTRNASMLADLAVEDEVFFRAGAGIGLGEVADDGRPPALLAATVSGTTTSDFEPSANQTGLELLAGPSIDLTRNLNLFAAGGAGLNEAVGTPDWRVLAGLRVSARGAERVAAVEATVVAEVEPPAPAPEPAPEPTPDTDGDTLADDVDRCVSDPEDADRFEDTDGCPDPDNDKDGVLDTADPCPLEAGPVENKGCPDTDRDSDTVVDRLDNCPDEPGDPKNHGCKKKQLVTIKQDRIEILQKVHFKTNSAVILKKSNALLENVASVLGSHPGIAMIEVQGHTDDVGDDEYNKGLSQRRADAVMAFLVAKGIAPERLRAVGYGESKPVQPGTSARARAANRRVEFVIVDERSGEPGT